MTNYQIKNSTEKAVKVSVSKEGKTEDHILMPGELREMPKLAGATLRLPGASDISLSQKKAISSKLSRIAKVVKEKHEKVNVLELPELFVALKIKKVHEE